MLRRMDAGDEAGTWRAEYGYAALAAVVGAVGGWLAGATPFAWLGSPASSLTRAAATALTACVLAVAVLLALTLLDRRRRSRDLGREISASMTGLRASIDATRRLARAEEIFTADPEGLTIDPQREPELHRLYQLWARRITAGDLEAGSLRDVAIERLAEDAVLVRELLAASGGGDALGDRTALRARIQDIERSIADVKARTGAP